MTNTFQIIQSSKVGLDSKESYIVTRDEISFLRILGADPEWQLMTATASEDDGRTQVCNEPVRLIEAALLLGVEIDTNPKVETDWKEREYVKVCVIKQESSEDDEAFDKELKELFIRFFEIYDSYKAIKTRKNSEMCDLYNALAIDDQGSDVYLSDGIWLTNDGSLDDRGRV